MITVNVKKLVSAIKEANEFDTPQMNDGTTYLYNNLYDKLLKNMECKLSDIDFDAFNSEDINSLNDLHSDVFEKNNSVAGNIVSALRKTAPICKAVCYV